MGIVMKSKVKELVAKEGCRLGGDLVPKLDELMEGVVKAAVKEAKAARRMTVRGFDVEVELDDEPDGPESPEENGAVAAGEEEAAKQDPEKAQEQAREEAQEGKDQKESETEKEA